MILKKDKQRSYSTLPRPVQPTILEEEEVEVSHSAFRPGHRKSKSVDNRGFWGKMGGSLRSGSKSPRKQNTIFGIPLQDIMDKQVATGLFLPVPGFISELINYLDREDVLKTVGIFRESGSANKIKELKESLDDGLPLNLIGFDDPHVVTGLLKLYIRELPEPLLTYELYDQFLAIERSKPSEEEYMTKVKALIEKLPPANRALLSSLIRLLVRVFGYSSVNKMTYENLAIVFAPTILRAKEETMISAMNDAQTATHFTQQLFQNYSNIMGGKL